MDIRAIKAYCQDIAPDIWQLYSEKYEGQHRIGVFLFEPRRKALWPSKGQEPAEIFFSHRDLSRRTGYPNVVFITD